jgi:hypothetical protein
MRSPFRNALATSLLAVAFVCGSVATSATASTATGLPEPTVVVQPQVALVWTMHSNGFFNEYTCRSYAFGIMMTHREYKDFRCRKDPAWPGRWAFWVLAPDGYGH